MTSLKSGVKLGFMDKKEALKIVKKNCNKLKNLPAQFKKDKEIVLEAVKKDGFAFIYADESLQKDICKQFNFTPSDSYLVATTYDKQWDRFKRESGVNRVCLTGAYEKVMND